MAPDQYAINLKAIFETLKPAASAVAFVSTTPYDMVQYPAGINMSCVLHVRHAAFDCYTPCGRGGTVPSDQCLAVTNALKLTSASCLVPRCSTTRSPRMWRRRLEQW